MQSAYKGVGDDMQPGMDEPLAMSCHIVRRYLSIPKHSRREYCQKIARRAVESATRWSSCSIRRFQGWPPCLLHASETATLEASSETSSETSQDFIGFSRGHAYIKVAVLAGFISRMSAKANPASGMTSLHMAHPLCWRGSQHIVKPAVRALRPCPFRYLRDISCNQVRLFPMPG